MVTRVPRELVLLAAASGLAWSCAESTSTGIGLGVPPVHLDVLAGNHQSAPAGTELPAPLVVRVTDENGDPAGGRIVNFRVTAGGGEVFAGVALTDSRGIAQEWWTLGPTPGSPQEVEARAVDGETGDPLVFATFEATAWDPAAPVATVTVEPSALEMEVGDTRQLTAAARDDAGRLLADREVTWSSSDPAVAEVTAEGRVTARSGGSVTITATSEGRSGSASVAVHAPVATVTVDPSSASITLAGTRQFTAALRDRNGNLLTGRAVAWTSSNPLVATVSADGLVTARLIGTATITAASEARTGTATVSVTVSSGLPPFVGERRPAGLATGPGGAPR